MQAAAVLLFLAFLLISMGTWLGPLLAVVLYKLSRPSGDDVSQNTAEISEFISLDVLIPAHFESESLPASLRFFNELASTKRTQFFTKIQTIVALSAWKGEESKMASSTASAVLEVEEPGKWKALQKLVQHSKADWVALVDAGTIWSADCLTILETLMKQPNVVVINPSYQEVKAGSEKNNLQKIIWSLESFLKRFENSGGGPISLHGSTILYRRKELLDAFNFLGNTGWLNDDVVVPLTVRSLFPEKRIVYTSEFSAMDLYPSSDRNEVQRRKRVLFGNIQWVQAFFLPLVKSNLVLASLATRRISRMMWAWWAVLPGLGLLFASLATGGSIWVLGFSIGAFLALAIHGSGRRLLEAFWVSLLSPFYFISYKQSDSKLQWK